MSALTDSIDAGELALARWAGSGLMWLTGRADGPPLGPPLGFIERLDALGDSLGRSTARLGATRVFDLLPLLAQRAAILGWQRRGELSCGGASRLIRASDGWFAMSLPRPDDRELLPALLGGWSVPADPWEAVGAAASVGTVRELVGRARLVGLAAAPVPVAGVLRPDGQGVRCTSIGPPVAPLASLNGVRVVDLSSLWAGPLCGAFMAELGATVTKVESTSRPDGARFGPEAFFEVLNGAKESVQLALDQAEGRRRLIDLIASADVVVVSSRPRAMRQFGVDWDRLLRDSRVRAVVSITGYGLAAAPGCDWIAYGDDAAAAGGLVCWENGAPRFCGDAIADPLSGLMALDALLDALGSTRRCLLDVAMSGVSWHFAGPTAPAGDHVAQPPQRAHG